MPPNIELPFAIPAALQVTSMTRLLKLALLLLRCAAVLYRFHRSLRPPFNRPYSLIIALIVTREFLVEIVLVRANMYTY